MVDKSSKIIFGISQPIGLLSGTMNLQRACAVLFLKGLNFEWNYTQLEFEPGTVEKNESTIGHPAAIAPTLLRCRCTALATELER